MHFLHSVPDVGLYDRSFSFRDLFVAFPVRTVKMLLIRTNIETARKTEELHGRHQVPALIGLCDSKNRLEPCYLATHRT